MKILKSKKAQDAIPRLPFWMFFVFAAGFASLTIVFMGNHFLSVSSRIPANLEDELILAPRFYSSENCFAYSDESGNTYIRTIDWEKFDQKNMANCFVESNVNYAFLLSLSVPELDDQGISKENVNTFNWMENKFANKKMLEEIIVFYDGKKYKGELEISIQNVQ